MTRVTQTVRALLRPLVHGARALRDRTLHPLRRDRARRAVRSAESGDTNTILFICTGNICRSPFAAKVFEQRGERTPFARVLSAGFLEPDRPSPEAAIRIAKRRGIELGSHRSHRVTAEDLGQAGLVVVMDSGHRRRIRAIPGGRECTTVLLGDLDPTLPERRAIPDPWGRPDPEFEACFERIERCLVALLALADPPARERR